MGPYSGLVALVFPVVMGVLACLCECLHVLVQKVVVQQVSVLPGNGKGYLLDTAYGISWRELVYTACVPVSVCVFYFVLICYTDEFVFFKYLRYFWGMLSYSLFCYGWMHGAHVQVLRCSFFKLHGCDCIGG